MNEKDWGSMDEKVGLSSLLESNKFWGGTIMKIPNCWER